MPTKRTRRTRNRTVRSLHTIDLMEILDFRVGWNPPISEFERSRSRWQTWQEFMEDYLSVRDEFLASDYGERDRETGELPFAERLYQQFGTNVSESYRSDWDIVEMRVRAGEEIPDAIRRNMPL